MMNMVTQIIGGAVMKPIYSVSLHLRTADDIRIVLALLFSGVKSVINFPFLFLTGGKFYNPCKTCLGELENSDIAISTFF